MDAKESTTAELLNKIVTATRIVDLTVLLEPNTPSGVIGGLQMQMGPNIWYTWPGDIRHHEKYPGKKPTDWRACEFLLVHGDHTGTHMDSPAHYVPVGEKVPPADQWQAFLDGKYTVDDVPLDILMGPACVIDVRYLLEGVKPGEHSTLEMSPWITVEDIKRWEEKHGPIREGEIVLFYTSWSDLHYKPYDEGHKYDMSHPALSADGVACLGQRGVKHVGIDAVGIGSLWDDYSPHYALFERKMIVTEKLVNLGQLPPRGAYFIFLPLKIRWVTGGMGRAIALV